MTSPGRTLWPYMARQWRALGGAGGATVVVTAADLAKPWPLALVVDRLLDDRSPPFELTPADTRLLAVIAGLVLAIAVAEAVARYACDLWLQAAGERITHELRTSVYDHLQRLSLGFHQRRPKGDLLTRVTGDVNAMGELFSQQLGAMTQAALLAVGIVVVLMVIDPLLAVLSLAPLPLLATVSFAYRRRIRSQARVRRAQEGRIASVAGEALSAMAVVKAFGSERFESERVRRGSEERMAAGVEVARLQARFDGLAGAVRALATALVLVAGVLRVAAGELSPGELIVFVSYTRKAQSPMRSIAREATKVAAAMARAERVAEILASDEVVEEHPRAYRSGRARGEVALERVSFSYEPGRPALSDVSLLIPPGGRVAVAGPSGAGKSTLGALIARVHDPTAGRVLIDGRDARECSLDWLRRQVGIVLQDTVLFSGTVRENIAYASWATPDEVEAAARAAAAHDFIAALPEGYDTVLGPQGIGLSGGQRQRIGIARTLLRDPPILVLDEPTTGLDAATEAQLIGSLEVLMRDRTTLLASHSPRLTRLADHVIRLEAGRRADAPPARPAPVADPALPQLGRLLDPGRMQPVLARSLEAGPDRLEVSRVVYKPHEIVAVHYRVRIAGGVHDAVATSIAGEDMAAGASKPRYVERARRIDGRSPAVHPLRYDADAGTIVTWLPFDPRLPALAEEGPELARRLRAAGSTSVECTGEPALVGYKPRGRAVLRIGEHVLKAYGRVRQYETALAGLVAASRCGAIQTGRFEAALPELRLTAQRSVEGTRPAKAGAVAGEAGEMLAALRRARLGPLPCVAAERHLEAAARKAAVVGAVLPALGPRLDALLDRLGGAVPADLPPAPAHGDFHVDQLLVTEGGLAVLDFDQMCMAAPALDLATYAADVVRGRASDLEAVQAVLEPLIAGYGGRPAALDWYLAAAILGRAAHPFQRQVPSWQERVEGMVATAEASL
jgi:ATP-binding cassette, subfamily B, bacterial